MKIQDFRKVWNPVQPRRASLQSRSWGRGAGWGKTLFLWESAPLTCTLAFTLAISLSMAFSPMTMASPDPPHLPIPGGLGKATCFDCHIRGGGIVLPSQERPRKYSVASAWTTYLKSPHGRLRALGDDRAPGCADCHFTQVWSEILPRSHPASPIHPDNLPRVCARCHGVGMLKSRVGEGSMHLELRPDSLIPGKPIAVRYGFLPGIMKMEESYRVGPFNVVAWVYFFFLSLTVGTLTTISAYMVLDLRRKLLDRRLKRKGDST